MKGPFNTCFSIRIIKPVGLKCCFVKLAEVFHFRSDYCVGANTTGHNNVAVVNDTCFTRSIHKLKGLGKKHLAFKPGETRIILDIDFPAVGKNQRGALSCNFASSKFEIMRRSVVLHLFAWFE